MKAYKYYKRSQGIGAIRTVLGLSQEALAMELGISRSLLSKAENKTRSLPTTVMLKLVMLHTRMAGSSETPGPAESKRAAAAHNLQGQDDGPALQLREQMRLDANLLEHRLQLMIAKHNNLVRCLHHVDSILAASEEKGLANAAFLKVHRANLLLKVTKCDPALQVSLQKKIALLRAAAASG